MLKHSEYLKNRKSFVTGNDSMSPELFEFYVKIFTAQEEFASECGDLSGYNRFFRNDAFPVLDAEDLVLDDKIKSLLSGLLLKLAGIISEVNDGMDLSALADSFTKDADLLLCGLLKQDYAILEKKGIENRIGLDEFIFVLHNTFKPFVTGLQNVLQVKPGRDEWLESDCPFCGYLPDMSKIVELKENQRLLHCALCENEWEFPRLVCPACGCNDQSKHGFFEFEDNDLYRVYYCDECKHYIKNIRIPKLKEESGYDPAVEDILTSFLDAAMMDKGYKRI